LKDHQPVTHYLKNYEPPSFEVDETILLVQLYEEGARITSTLHLRRREGTDPRQPVVLDGVDLVLENIRLNGRLLAAEEYHLSETALLIHGVPDAFELITTTWIKPQENTCLEGLYRSSSLFCTQCEAEGFRRITYYPDRPDVMARFRVTLVADRERYPVLLSNGNPLAEGDTAGGRHWVTWEDPFPKPAYLFALVAGKLEWLEDSYTTASGREVLLRIYVEEGNLSRCDHAMASLKRSMRWDEEVYGREYDLDRFNIVAVSDFNMGAMENKGLNIFNASCVLANPKTATDQAFQRIEAIVAHEYFHNWSGNRVTCRDWFQLSLKEGFTVFRDAAYTADRYGHAVKRIDDATLMRTQQFAEDAGPMAHPIRPDSYMEISNFYTLTIYEKGAEVVGMLHRLLGAKTFRQGSDLYFSRHDGQAVTTEDFVACMEDASGRDLGQFRNWYRQAGTPRLELAGAYDTDRQRFTLNVKQSTPPTRGQPIKVPLHIPLEVALFDGQGRLMAETHQVLEVRESESSFEFERVSARPVISLLRHFSAPVKVHYPYTRQELCLLMEHDTDGFSRWDAGQTLALELLMEQIARVGKGLSVELDSTFAMTWCGLLENRSLDRGLLARLIQIPSLALLAERLESIPVDAMLEAREAFVTLLTRQAMPHLWALYQRLLSEEITNPEDLSPAAMGRRALKNQCLSLLCGIDHPEALQAAFEQQRRAVLMTEEQGGLSALLQSQDRPQTVAALAAFEQRWLDDPLVMESWFSLQAASQRFSGLEHIQSLTQHARFSERNPNKVRAVIATFAAQNWKAFHNRDGSGYAFLQDWILRLNRLNPQIASRLVTPLTRWRKYTPERSTLMQAVLQRLMKEKDLSSDVYELVFKSLE
jgi:aminopeptidase N